MIRQHEVHVAVVIQIGDADSGPVSLEHAHRIATGDRGDMIEVVGDEVAGTCLRLGQRCCFDVDLRLFDRLRRSRSQHRQYQDRADETTYKTHRIIAH